MTSCETVTVPTWVYKCRGLNVTALRLLVAMYDRAERGVTDEGDACLIWSESLASLVPSVPSSSLVTGVACLAKLGLFRQEPGRASTGRRGRRPQVSILLELPPTSGETQPPIPPKSAANQLQSQAVFLARARAGHSTTSTDTTTNTTDSTTNVHSALAQVLRIIGVNEPEGMVRRFGPTRVASALRELAAELERDGASVNNPAGWFVAIVRETPETEAMGDLSFLATWAHTPKPENVRDMADWRRRKGS